MNQSEWSNNEQMVYKTKQFLTVGGFGFGFTRGSSSSESELSGDMEDTEDSKTKQ